jgi:predicted HicB family RNase H-like nuclease
VSQARPRASSQLHLRIPPEEKAKLRAEARRHQVSMSALVRISVMAAREVREREAMLRETYPRV